MKKTLLLLIVSLTLTSCKTNQPSCPAYGNHPTKLRHF